MPYSDNPYMLGDDSDQDEYTDQLSPSDGYFASSSPSNVVPNVPNVLVEDPTLHQTETAGEAKVREANGESPLSISREHSSTQRGATSSAQEAPRASGNLEGPWRQLVPTSSPSPRAPHLASPATVSRTRTASLYSEAPPAYTPLTTSPLSPSSRGGPPGNYHTFAYYSGPSRPTPIEYPQAQAWDPENMGGPPNQYSEDIPHWKRVTRRLPRWVNWKTTLLPIFVLIVIMGFFTNTWRVTKGSDGGNSKIINPTEPVRKPVNPTDPVPQPEAPFEATFCRGADFRYPDQIIALSFNTQKSVTFKQDVLNRPGKNELHIGGQVNIRKLPEGGDARMVAEIITNDRTLKLDVSADEQGQYMKINAPTRFNSSLSGIQPCVEMRVTIWVPEGADLQFLEFNTVHLDILLFDDLSLRVADWSKFTTTSGHIVSGAQRPWTYDTKKPMTNAPDGSYLPVDESYKFNSRRIEVATTSGQIGGNFPMYDHLSFQSSSGAIRTSITPKADNSSSSKTATLSIGSVAGNIQVTEPIHERDLIPARDYRVEVRSTSGVINAALAFGSRAEFKESAGPMTLNLLPVVNATKFSPANPLYFETSSVSGHSSVNVLDPVWYGAQGGEKAALSQSFNCLRATHKATSANIELRYPQTWEGDYEAQTTIGQLSARGRDLKIIKSIGGFGGSKMIARKGGNPERGASMITVRATSGSVDALIGDA